MTGYKMNFATKTLTITKAFAAKAMLPNTDEANLILNMRNLLPDLKITYKTHSCSTSHPYKGLTYNRMENYIRCHENEEELMAAFRSIKMIATTQNNPHNYVCHWFMRQFPTYHEIPVLKDGKIAGVRPITLPKETMQTASDYNEELAA